MEMRGVEWNEAEWSLVVRMDWVGGVAKIVKNMLEIGRLHSEL
jgi:hypothetical protein